MVWTSLLLRHRGYIGYLENAKSGDLGGVGFFLFDLCGLVRALAEELSDGIRSVVLPLFTPPHPGP